MGKKKDLRKCSRGRVLLLWRWGGGGGRKRHCRRPPTTHLKKNERSADIRRPSVTSSTESKEGGEKGKENILPSIPKECSTFAASGGESLLFLSVRAKEGKKANVGKGENCWPTVCLHKGGQPVPPNREKDDFCPGWEKKRRKGEKSLKKIEKGEPSGQRGTLPIRSHEKKKKRNRSDQMRRNGKDRERHRNQSRKERTNVSRFLCRKQVSGQGGENVTQKG